MASHNKRTKPVTFPFIETKNHVFEGVTWFVNGSKGKVYEVDMQANGFVCTCPGFAFHHKCKHTTEIARRIVPEDVPSL